MAAILVIDDYEGFRQAMAYCLPKFGHAVLTAATTAVGAALAREHEVELVLLDAGYPPWPGLAECAVFKGVPELSRLPVVLLSDGVSAELERRARAAGADAVLGKPIEWAELMRLVATLVPERESRTG